MAQIIRALRRLSLVPQFRRAAPALCYANTATPNESTIPTDVEQATGLEKKEIDALMAGEEDPFKMAVNSGPWGTKDKPTVVPSMYEERIVGCICDEDTTGINWMVLKTGSSQRCECGHWFHLAKANPTNIKI